MKIYIIPLFIIGFFIATSVDAVVLKNADEAKVLIRSTIGSAKNYSVEYKTNSSIYFKEEELRNNETKIVLDNDKSKKAFSYSASTEQQTGDGVSKTRIVYMRNPRTIYWLGDDSIGVFGTQIPVAGSKWKKIDTTRAQFPKNVLENIVRYEETVQMFIQPTVLRYFNELDTLDIAIINFKYAGKVSISKVVYDKYVFSVKAGEYTLSNGSSEGVLLVNNSTGLPYQLSISQSGSDETSDMKYKSTEQYTLNKINTLKAFVPPKKYVDITRVLNMAYSKLKQ